MMISVYRLPEKLTDGFCFGGGKPIAFLNVDWFAAEPPPGAGITPTPEQLQAFIRGKGYYDPSARYLILDDRPGRTFVMERAAEGIPPSDSALVRQDGTAEREPSNQQQGEGK